MSPRPRPGRLVAAGMAAIIVIVGCGGPAPSISPEASFLPSPSGDPFPSAPPSTGAFERMAYPAEGPAPCEEPASDDPAYGPYEGSLQRVFARDEHTVVFELCDSDPAFLAKVASPALAIDDTAWLQSRLDPADGGAPRILTEVNGTGPFRLDTWDGTSDITLSRSETYWGVRALTPSVIVTGEGDAGQRLAKLRDGSVDAVDEIAAADIEAVEANPELTLAPRQGLNIAYIGFDNRFAPFDNETVRQAIAMGIDRAAIVDAGFPPGTRVATHFLPCAIPYGCGGNAWPEMDAEAARDMLADVGFPDGFTSTISFPQEPRDYLPDPNATALALQAQLQDQLGIRTTLKPMPFDELVAAADAGRLEGFYLLGARARYPDASLLLESHFGPGASLQFGNSVRRHPELAAPRPHRRRRRSREGLPRRQRPAPPPRADDPARARRDSGGVPQRRQRQAGERDLDGPLRVGVAGRPHPIRLHAARPARQSLLRGRDRRCRASRLRPGL